MIRFHAAVPASFLLLSFSVFSLAFLPQDKLSNVMQWCRMRPRCSKSRWIPRQSWCVQRSRRSNLRICTWCARTIAKRRKHISGWRTRILAIAVYLNKLGIALHQQEALTLALKYYERATKVDPSYADAQNNIGTVWYQRKKYGKAIKSTKKL